MYESFLKIIGDVGNIVWGLPTILLLVGTGLWLTIRLRGLQFTKLWHALYLAFIKRKEDADNEGDISHFAALMTALAATVGTGNIAGVATAIAVGGPGALFWMFMTGLVGMVTKYSEALLAVKYRVKDKNGNMCGGPMYYIEHGLGWKWMGVLFAIFASIATFGIGNVVQSNSVAHALSTTFSIPTWITAIVLAVGTGAVILGGIKTIGKFTSILVPVMIIFYVGGALLIILLHLDRLWGVLQLIMVQAFTPTAAFGGFAGSAVLLTIRMGVARGLFSNESGLGSAPIAAAAAQTKNPVTQALVSMTQTFIDTIVVCSMTGIVIILSGEWSNGKTGAELSSIAFTKGMGSVIGEYIVTIGLVLFAFSTLIGWSYYGEKAMEYLFGEKVVFGYRVFFTFMVAIGCLVELDLVWGISDIFNGLMALPNLIAILLLTPVIVSESNKYLNNKEFYK
ncbi:MAG: sodium:alanine symporter family protein [bacterium]